VYEAKTLFAGKKVSYMGINSVVPLKLRAKEWVLACRHCPYIIYFSADLLNLLEKYGKKAKN